MTTWKLIFIWILPYIKAGDEGVYECGAHGRFEYCIDGIPGCVVGCHCHPGYYFDTETKICEPNTKLTQNYRRNYVPQPTRVQYPILEPDALETETLSTLTTHNVLDEHVNDIAKNADDLGDWLYNQFFKTIETQVINNTIKDSQLTRRSGRGSNPTHNKPKRRSRKRGKKRHRKRKKSMKEKILQIPEDDSLFESSQSDSDDDSYSSDTSGSSSDSDSDDDHGHKKILLINKKPRPPLPSFIFLPHMNTPFFPPIGLPPPPVMPMYPMVPVPPVVPPPPMLPYPDCEENTTTTIITTTKMLTTTSEVSKTTNSIAPTASDAEEPQTGTPIPERSRYKGRKRKKLKPTENIVGEEDEEDPLFNPPQSTRDNRQKLLQQLRQRIGNPAFKRNKNLFKSYINQLIPPDTPMDANNVEDVVLKNENTLLDNYDEMPEQENVDFKYLSQLIHRGNQTGTRDRDIPLDGNPNSYIQKTRPGELPTIGNRNRNVPIQSGRRMNQQMVTSRGGQMDENYYSNLGRQIASLIRSIDADNERQLNIEIEKVQQKSDDQLFFSENSPRTFWERSVRSPLKFMYPFRNRYDYLKNSNEMLFNIENKVETVATTVPTLSLQEIENMIKVMETAQTRFQSTGRIKNVKPSSKTLNINLWPQEIKQSKNSIKSSAGRAFFNTNRKFLNYSNGTRPKAVNNSPNILMQSHHASGSGDNTHKQQDLSRLETQMQPALKSTSTTLYFIRNRTLTTYPQTAQQLNGIAETNSHKFHYSMNPTVLKYKNFRKFFFDGNNHYSFQNDDAPIHFSETKIIGKHPVNSFKASPYFHHEINHVDFMPLE